MEDQAKRQTDILPILDLDNPLFESLWLYFRPPRLPRFPHSFSCIIIGIIYHPPLRSKAEYLISSLDTVLNKYPNAGVLSIGDFKRLNFRILRNNFSSRQLIKAPTRGNATLDLTKLFQHYQKPDILATINLFLSGL